MAPSPLARVPSTWHARSGTGQLLRSHERSTRVACPKCKGRMKIIAACAAFCRASSFPAKRLDWIARPPPRYRGI